MKYKSLESLRGIAALLVALFHSSFMPESGIPVIAQGDLFVDFFFILSGFVISYAYIDKISQGLPFRNFLLLRIGRLYPLHLFVLLCWIPFILVKAYLHFTFQIGADPFVFNNVANFIADLFLLNAFGLTNSLAWNGPAWSIGAELFAYIVFFAVVYLAAKRPKLVVFSVVSIVSYLALTSLSKDTLLSTYQYGFVRCLAGFFFGALLFCLTKEITMSMNKATASALEVVVVLVTLFCVSNASLSKAYQFASFLCFGALIVTFSLQESGGLSAFLKTKTMLFLGMLSYSIYMTHSLLFIGLGDIVEYFVDVQMVGFNQIDSISYGNATIMIFMNALSLALVIAVSTLTYNCIEKPWRDKFRMMVVKMPA